MKGKCIFLSPHHDDICFSLACTAMAAGGGTLINLFSESDYVAGPMQTKMGSQRNRTSVTALRSKEDQEFCSHTNLQRHDLGLIDAALRGVDPFDCSDLLNEARIIAETLTPFFGKLASLNNSEATTLFCPMGIGGHRDHVATLGAILMLQHQLPANLKIRFYEDLHYASNRQKREEGLQRFKAMADRAIAHKSAFRLMPADLAIKLKLVTIYGSQHEHPPRISDYFPADTYMHGPHEAAWELIASEQV